MKKRIRTHTNPLNIRQRLTDPLWQDQIHAHSIICLEIGFGKGRFMNAYAENHDDQLIVGVEVRQQMVQAFTAKPYPDNCLPIWGAGHICLEDLIPDRSLSKVFIFHPDPWFKKRHHKRRVINTSLLATIKTKMRSGGRVYISTDVKELYDDIMAVLLEQNDKQYISGDPFWVTDYTTHWSQFSIRDARSQFLATFQFISLPNT
jgi:tRNA (guanine-N7-)-methyltransferase